MRKAGISFRLPQLAVQALSEHYSQQVGRALETAALLVREAVPLPQPAVILTETRAKSRRRRA